MQGLCSMEPVRQHWLQTGWAGIWKPQFFLANKVSSHQWLPLCSSAQWVPTQCIAVWLLRIGNSDNGSTYCKFCFDKWIGFSSLERGWQMTSFFFKCFNDFTALLLSTMMKARSLVYLTTFENETTFNFSGKTALEISCFLLGPVLLMENWTFCSGIVKVMLSSCLIFQNFLVSVFR